MHNVETLILAWGNAGRRDDGLGPALAERLRALNLPGVLVDSDYQLHIEAAAELGHCRRVVFVDADRSGPEPFWVKRLEPAEEGLSFSTHSVSPGALLALARDLFHSEPEAWILGIRAAAIEYLKQAIRTSRFSDIRTADHHEGEPCLTTNH